MNQEFLNLYNDELRLFYEHAKEFAEEFPGIADRLGGMDRENADPMFKALLQGAAFLAARVQLKIRHEFPEFTNNLIEQLLPGFLAPTPSAMLVQFQPPYGDPALRNGRTIRRGAELEAAYRERERRHACRYRLCSDTTLWPFEITKAEYYGSPGPLQAMGVQGSFGSGLHLKLRLRSTMRPDLEPSDDEARMDPMCLFAGCPVMALPFYLVGPEADAAVLYEEIFAHREGVHIRYTDQFGANHFADGTQLRIEQVGFDEDEALFPHDPRSEGPLSFDPRMFRGFSLLGEYFAFSRKFLGFRLTTGANSLFPVPARDIDLIVTFRNRVPRLGSVIDPGMFALYTAPAVNLFRPNAVVLDVSPSQHEHQVVMDRDNPRDLEPHTILDVVAQFAGSRRRETLRPLYDAPPYLDTRQRGGYYTVRRRPRRLSEPERKLDAPSQSRYVGSEMFISLPVPAGTPEEGQIEQISVRALCSNRHLAGHLATYISSRRASGGQDADFVLLEDTSVVVRCLIGPTHPKESLLLRTADAGPTAWRLINLLSLNQRGIMRPDGETLRQTLSLFADTSDPAVSQRIAGLRGVTSEPTVRRIRNRLGIGVARGIEITVLFDETSFEGSGVLLLGAVLERFFAEYAPLNHFVQTVIRTEERGNIHRWPPRSSSRTPL